MAWSGAFSQVTLADPVREYAVQSVECLKSLSHWFAYPPSDLSHLRSGHIRMTERGDYQVLMPSGADRFRIEEVGTLPQARALADLIQYPLDFEGVGVQLEPQMETLVATLRELKSQQDFDLTYRVKAPESLRKKVFKLVRDSEWNELSLSRIVDVVGTRIAVQHPGDIPKMIKQIDQYKDHGIMIDHALTKHNRYERGYRATHLRVRVNGGPPMEVQIMTRRMKAWVEWNASRVYKPKFKPTSPKGKAYVERLKAYNDEVIRRINAIDEAEERGEYPDIRPPNAGKKGFNIMPEDRFPNWPFKL